MVIFPLWTDRGCAPTGLGSLTCCRCACSLKLAFSLAICMYNPGTTPPLTWETPALLYRQPELRKTPLLWSCEIMTKTSSAFIAGNNHGRARGSALKLVYSYELAYMQGMHTMYGSNASFCS